MDLLEFLFTCDFAIRLFSTGVAESICGSPVKDQMEISCTQIFAETLFPKRQLLNGQQLPRRFVIRFPRLKQPNRPGNQYHLWTTCPRFGNQIASTSIPAITAMMYPTSMPRKKGIDRR